MLGAGSGTDWLSYRLAFAEYFARGYRDDVSRIPAIVSEGLDRWESSGRIPLLAELYRIACEIRGRIFFGATLDCYRDLPGQPAFSTTVDRLLQPDVVFIGAGGALTEQFHARLLAVIERSPPEAAIAHACRTRLESGEWTESEAVQNASMFMLAQAPTMLNFWILYRAACDGACQRMHKEPRWALQRIQEEIRMHPGVPSMVTRVALKDDAVGPMNLPAESVFLTSPLLIHRSAELWSDPDSFRPERWQIDGDDASALIKQPQGDPRPGTAGRCPITGRQRGSERDLRFMPFGHGQHRCLGFRFALEEVVAVVRTVLERFELSVVDDADLLRQPIDAQVAMHVYNRPRHDVTLSVRNRTARETT